MIDIDFDFAKHWRIIILIVLILAGISVIITIIIGNFRNENARIEDSNIGNSNGNLPEYDLQEFTVYPESLMIPNIPEELWRGIYEPYRSPKKQWGMEELKKFLYDPLDLAADNLRRINQESIREILERYR